MRFIKAYAEMIHPDGYNLDDIYKHIERAGRTCYRSEMSNDPKAFVNKLISSGHTSVLEHGTLYFDVPMGTPGFDSEYSRKSAMIQFFKKNKYSVVNPHEEEVTVNGTIMRMTSYAITTNFRVFREQVPWEALGPLRTDKVTNMPMGMTEEYMLHFLCKPSQYHEKRYTFRFVTDRGVSHELVRHRVLSFSQESTRYCNYSKGKFGGELTYIIPAPIRISINPAVHCMLPEGEYVKTNGVWCNPQGKPLLMVDVFSGKPQAFNAAVNRYLDCLQECEDSYMDLIAEGWIAQEARRVLPVSIKTELVITGNAEYWDWFFAQRVDGTTGTPHPDMYIVASQAKEIYDYIISQEE